MPATLVVPAEAGTHPHHSVIPAFAGMTVRTPCVVFPEPRANPSMDLSVAKGPPSGFPAANYLSNHIVTSQEKHTCNVDLL
jgi:hypothetical protein